MQIPDDVIDVPAVSVVQVPRVWVVCEIVEKTVENPETQTMVVLVPQMQVVEKTTKIQQLQDADKVVNVSVLSVVQAPLAQVMAKTVQTPQLLLIEKIVVIPRIQTVQGPQTSESLGIECDEGHELMLQGNDSVSVAKDVEDKANEVSDKSPDCMVCSSASGSTRQQHKQRATTQTAQEERERGRKGQWGRDQEGRKKEEREAEEGGSELVEKDVTGWTEVTRNKRKKVVQIFVKVIGMKTVAMEVSPEDKVQKILNTVSGSERDVYVTSGGRILRGSDKLKSFGVRDGSTVEVTSRMRGGGGKHREKKSKIEKERSGSPKKIEQTQGQKAEVEPCRNVDEMYVLMEEQMRLMSEEAKSLQVTDEVMQRIVEHVVRMRLMTENMKKQASDDDLQTTSAERRRSESRQHGGQRTEARSIG